MLQGWCTRAKVLAHRFGATWQVDNEGTSAHPSHPTRQHAHRSRLQTRQAHGLSNPRHFIVNRAQRNLGSHVARRQTGSSSSKNEVDVGSLRQMEQRFPNQLLLVGHHSIVHLQILNTARRQSGSNCRSTSVLALAAGALVANGNNSDPDHGCRTNSPLLPPALCNSSILVSVMPRSTALHMSYTVSAATETAVSASISTPVRLVTRTVARISNCACSTSSSNAMSTPLIGSGWHNGIRSGVRFAAITPATCATARTSPLATPPEAIKRAVSGCITTIARAVASRRVTSLSETSTIRARPDSSRCVNPLLIAVAVPH